MDLKEQYDKLLRYCYMKTKDKYLAEDITQETFLKFWESKSYKNTGKEMAYLYTIARNKCMDEFRKRKDLVLDDFPNLSEEFKERNERVKGDIDIDRMLEKLPDDLREIVVLRYLNQMSATDIGKVIGLSRFAVNRRLQKGLSMLKEIIEKELENEE